METSMSKRYLGDGVYAQIEDYGDLILTTENGVRVTNRIVLEPAVLLSLLKFVKASPDTSSGE